MDADAFKQWAILELMGHRKIAGLVSEEQRFGVVMARIDIPGPGDAMVSQFYGGGSIFSCTPVSEEVARAFARNSAPAPVSRWELRLPERATPDDAELGDEHDEEDYQP